MRCHAQVAASLAYEAPAAAAPTSPAPGCGRGGSLWLRRLPAPKQEKPHGFGHAIGHFFRRLFGGGSGRLGRLAALQSLGCGVVRRLAGFDFFFSPRARITANFLELEVFTMSIPATQMRPGMIIKYKDDLHLVFSDGASHAGQSAGRLSRQRLRNVRTGSMFTERFRFAPIRSTG